MHNLAPQIRAEKDSLLSPYFKAVKRVLSATADYWTWTTADGKEYNDVVPLQITADSVTFRHKYGIDSVKLTNLSPMLQKELQASVATPPEAVSNSCLGTTGTRRVEPTPVLHSLHRPA